MMALLSLPAPSSSHWGVCSETPGCKKGTLSVCVCMNAQVHAFRRCSSPPCFPSISTQCKQSFKNRQPGMEAVSKTDQILYFLWLHLRWRTETEALSPFALFRPNLNQRDEGDPCAVLTRGSVYPEMRQEWACCDFHHFFYPPMLSPVALPDLCQAAGAHSISKAPCWVSWCLAARRDAFDCRLPWPKASPDMLSMFSVKTHSCP